MTNLFRLLGLAACLCGAANASELAASASALASDTTSAIVETASLTSVASTSTAISSAASSTTASIAASAPSLDTIELPRDPGSPPTVDLTTKEDDIWMRIRHGFGMTDLHSDIVDQRQKAYLAHPEQLKLMLERSRKYMFHIVGELEKRGMPTELALLPIVESAYNPMALSSAKAAGLWQFIPSTGKDFNLTQNWWVDERRDIVASTNAALQYLQAIYEMHGDWQLTLASYNWGENAVAHAIEINRNAGLPTDYNSLRMPLETRQYVPKLQALKNIIAHPEEYGIELPSIPNQPYFVTVDRPQGIDVALAAKLAELPVAEFLSLNPSYNRPVIPGSQANPLVLPVDNARLFQQNLAQHSEPLVNWRTYALPKTARIEDVARNLHLTATVLRAANGLRARARLAAGYILLIPNAAAEQMQSMLNVVMPGSSSTTPQTSSRRWKPARVKARRR
ncbi:MAG TPA: transglycosylase SLT domain-containing protein [Rhodocyclaceae bacterium]|nr:transglycosylase SLT domain-containing protein [Rhodocyclaceae bacterium]